MKQLFLKTLGCKVNSYDGYVIESGFKELGFELISDYKKASILILNTCTVTSKADSESLYLLRRYRRENPEGFIVVTGCMAQTTREKLTSLPYIDLIVPNEVKGKLVDYVYKMWQSKGNDIKPESGDNQTPVLTDSNPFGAPLKMEKTTSERTRGFLRIQDGCNCRCSYCIIPLARGKSRSVVKEDILEEIESSQRSGLKEIIFSGIHIGDYGKDLSDHVKGKNSFTNLFADIFKRISSVSKDDSCDKLRVRISSIEPMELEKEFLELAQANSELFCDHFHIPLQSGCDSVLKRMNRPYTTGMYLETVKLIRHYFPKAHIGTDLIVGFPGESEEEFAATIKFIENTDIDSLHVFPYSKREKTKAADMPDHVSPVILKERVKIARELSDKKFKEYQTSFINDEVEVLWEKSLDKKGRRIGKSVNYLDVVSSTNNEEPGSITKVLLKRFTSEGKILGESIL